MARSITLSRSARSVHITGIARYAAVGLINLAIDVGGYAVLATVVGLPAVLSNILSFSAAIMVSYLLNSEWTFRDRDARSKRQFVRFFGLNLIGLSLSTVLVFLFAMAVDKMLAKGLSIPIVFFYNYFGCSRFVFRAHRGEHAING
ncbi:GtrA family protein [Rhizorhabdus argentea]|uniref:GtrA family protein n=1 Tax=Rhizorhabdus argentea TaxID=1387174 RepID=UPI0030EE7D49